ncbi:MAG TPA: hypothetical protein VEO54_25555 [Thermoanaerobaculia bacterium]|nr:hypothetical protein [Thermoanaerobaculia bacterium]
MKRGILDTLRRGLDNALVNWGLIIVRLVEVVVLVAITIAAVLAMVVPILLSIGLRMADITTPDQIESTMLTLLERWSLLVFIFLGLLLLTIVLVALHSVVDAGCARVQVDADRMAGPAVDGPRSRYHAFSMARWWAGARDGWRTVFWIYNFAWGLAGLILLLPLLPTLALTIVLRENEPMAIGIGCLGLAVSLLLLIVVGVVTNIWTNRAIADWAVARKGAAAALSGAWAAIKADLGRHVVIAVAMVVLAIAGSTFFSSFSYFAAFGEMMHQTSVINFFTIPLRLLGTLANWGFSSFVASWILGAYAALAVENVGRASARPEAG